MSCFPCNCYLTASKFLWVVPLELIERLSSNEYPCASHPQLQETPAPPFTCSVLTCDSLNIMGNFICFQIVLELPETCYARFFFSFFKLFKKGLCVIAIDIII